MGKQRQTGRRRQRQAERKLIGARLGLRERRIIAGMHAGCDARNDHRRNCDGGNPERQLVEPVGVVEPRHRRGRGRGNRCGRDQLELWDTGGDQARKDTGEERVRLIGRLNARCQRRPVANHVTAVTASWMRPAAVMAKASQKVV